MCQQLPKLLSTRCFNRSVKWFLSRRRKKIDKANAAGKTKKKKAEQKFNFRRSLRPALCQRNTGAHRDKSKTTTPQCLEIHPGKNVRLLSRTNCRLLAWLILLQSKAIRAERHGKNGRINKGIKEMDTKRAGKQREREKKKKEKHSQNTARAMRRRRA